MKHKSEIDPLVGSKLKAIRTLYKKDLSETAEALDINPTYVSLIETGKKSPSFKVLVKASKYFSVPLSYFSVDTDLSKQVKSVESFLETLNDEMLLAVSYALERKIKERNASNN